jgi:hypothetical protein
MLALSLPVIEYELYICWKADMGVVEECIV